MRVPRKMELAEIQACFQEIIDAIKFLDTGKASNIDLKGRRIQNAGKAVLPDDYVTLKELKEVQKQIK